MQHAFQRVAIVNRGEAAMRFIHAVREYNLEQGASLVTIALYTEPDQHAMFVREADEAVSLGPAHVIDTGTNSLKSAYVDYALVQRALAAARADAVWVGWGFVAEHADFADLCKNNGIIFIGPDGNVMRRLGDKIASKLLAEQAQIPVAPWSGGPVETLTEARHHAERLGYPLLIKATAGGGGHGIRKVHSASELPRAFETARAEAFKAFGNPAVFMEKLVQNARHVEVQIIADHYGTTWAAGVRDCTIQRRHQKIMEEAPSPALSSGQDRALRQAAVRLSQAALYHNAGTVEFLYQPEERLFSFMEMNTRLQVEHPVTECTTGLDLVKLQIHVARGGRLEGDPPLTTGHAIEVRLNAEDPDNKFAPAPGAIERFKILTGPGVRIDTGVVVGDSVAAEFDSMIAKLIAYGHNRKEALSRLRRALRESVIVIKGGTSNKSFLLELLGRGEVERGEVDIGWMDRLAASGEHISRHYADVAILAAAIEAYNEELAIERAQFYASAVRGRPQVRSAVGRTVALRHCGESYSLDVCRLDTHRYRIGVDGSRVEMEIVQLGPFEYWLTSGGQRFHIVSVTQGLKHRIEVDGVAHQIDRDDGGVVHAPAPAVVVSIAVKPGETIAAGDRVAVLEAMKMEMEVVAPFSGKVRSVMVIPNVQVDTGAPLLQIDPAEQAASTGASARVVFGAARNLAAPGEKAASRYQQNLQELRQLTLGFDVQPAQIMRLLSEPHRSAHNGAKNAREAENEILSIFVDICSLFQRQPTVDGASSGQTPSAEAYMFTYLRMVDTRGEGLPPAFMNALRRTLAHYGVTSFDRSSQLDDALLWIYKSHQRVEQQAALILSLLERRLLRAEDVPPANITGEFRTLLDRLVSVTSRVYPVISDMAREVRYRYFDQPLFEQARKQVLEQIEESLLHLTANPEATDRREAVSNLVECPYPLLGLFASKFAEAPPSLLKLMLEVLTRRYYRNRMLLDLRCWEQDGKCYLAAEYEHEGKRIHIFASDGDYAKMTETVCSLLPMISEVPADHDIGIELYVWHSEALGNPEAMQAEVRGMLNAAGFPRPIRRIVVAIGGPGRGHGVGGMQHFTYRLVNGVYEEEKFYRGIHPMMGKRLHLWRLTNFNIERLPSIEDVYVLRGVARDNPSDERLFVCAEVRDLTPVRDEKGHVRQLPHLERMFAEALAAIRLFQSRRKPHERLWWNRILLNVWPPLNLRADELHEIVHRLLPDTEGLGLEQVVVRARIPNPETGELRDMVVRISIPAGSGVLITFRPASKLQPIRPLPEYDQKVVRLRRRGLIYPYEIIKMITPAMNDARADFPPGNFVEHDLGPDDRLVPVDRPYGQNKSNIIAGVIRNFTPKYPEGMTRVVLLGDPGKDLGALAESECRRIIAALNLAQVMGVPLEWFPISAGAKISMESGVENMDWIARVLRRLVEFTQAGGEVNLLINGINVGAQPYWNAEATMLMHTRGILVMTPKAAMVLTGKRALDYSGGVSAEDNEGIGGYDRIMGLNGQAQYWARDISEACHILFRHYEHTYLMPGERFPRRAVTTDPIERDVQTYPHSKNGEDGFAIAGEIFSNETNPGRKKSFDIRRVMMAVVDQDHTPLERWSGMRGAETAVVWDAHLGGYPACVIGIESRPVPRLGFVPADGPDQWCAGTLFPQSSKKVARAINAASNNRPVVVLANLSGFDGSPESMRKLQLEYGAEIGRAVVNFKGPMVFCVISRYHGGAYVVFSRTLNEQLEVVALEGTYASVIGGAPAAAVVFASEVEARAKKDPRLQALNDAMASADSAEKNRLRKQWEELFKVVHSEKLGEMAEQFDHVHNVQRALDVGALNRIIPPATLRPYLIHALERGLRSEESQKLEGVTHKGVSAIESAA